jgi:hypothetical protein
MSCEANVLVDPGHVAGVGTDGEGVAAGAVRDLPELGDGGEAGDVGLDVMHRAGVEEVAEMIRRVQPFAKGDGRGD